MLKIDTSKVLSTEMDRKGFLKAAAFGLVAMSGVAAALKATGVLQLNDSNSQAASTSATDKTAKTHHGYGVSTYGGGRANS